MLEVIAYLSVGTLVSLVAAYLYVEAQRRKAIIKKKKAIFMCVSKIKSNFQVELNKLVERGMLTTLQHKSLYRLANNFFVFQSVTTKSIELCEHSLNNVVSAMPKCSTESVHFERVQQQVKVFVHKLPKAANGFNANFYRNELPNLVKQLVDAIENIYKVESELSDLSHYANERPTSSSPSEAA